MPFPLGLERRDIDDDAAARIRRLAETHREYAARDSEILHRARERKRIRRNDAHVRIDVDETLLVEGFRINDGRVDVGEDLELARAAYVVAVARGAVGNDPLPVDGANLTGFEGFDHPV